MKWFHLFGCNHEKYLFGWCHKKVCCVWRQRQFFALAFPWLTMKLHDCRPVDNLVKLQTKDDGLPLVFALFVNSSGVYSTKNIAKFYSQKLWDYKSLQKSNLIHNFNFCPNLIFWIYKLKIEFYRRKCPLLKFYRNQLTI